MSLAMHAAPAGPVLRLPRSGPRYTSYPTADRFSDGFGYRDYLHAVADLRTRGAARPLSLYLDMPFGDKVYLAYLKREIEMQGRLFAGMSTVEQLYCGGMDTCLSDAQMGELMAHLRRCFQLAPDGVGEYGIEVDSRSVTPARVASLRRQGFNRIVLGVQDVDAHMLHALIAAARDAGFRSVSIALIDGLPTWTPDAMRATLDKVVAADPDRVALSPVRQELRMLQLCTERLGAAGYVYIGMDHFAKPDDDLAIAQAQGRLHRNFLGYSTHADTDLVACGVSSIGAVGATYSQNVEKLDAYYEAIDRNELPVARGVRLTMDDALRRSVIQRLMCQFELSISAVEQAFPIVFHKYFAAELAALAPLARDGLVEIGPDWISVTAKGRLLIRNVCMAFDRYLAQAAQAPQVDLP
jgi:oxygen-independent coproporphyrinogen-3 oxidase